MAGVNILLADGDEQYLLALVRKFIEGFENDGDIEMISDAAYLEEYFQTPRSLDIVVIQEEMYRGGIPYLAVSCFSSVPSAERSAVLSGRK